MYRNFTIVEFIEDSLLSNRQSLVRVLVFCIIALLFLSACSIHKIDVQQGNVITQEMMENLKIGMDKNKILRLLGTPLVKDPFREGRWDYLYKFVAGDTGETQSSHVTLFFDNDILSNINIREAPIAETDVKKTHLRKR